MPNCALWRGAESATESYRSAKWHAQFLPNPICGVASHSHIKHRKLKFCGERARHSHPCTLTPSRVDSSRQRARCLQVCDGLTYPHQPVCPRCHRDPQLSVSVLTARAARLQRQYTQLVRVCLSCGGGGARSSAADGAIACRSLDCGIFFDREKLGNELATAEALARVACELF